MATYYDKAFDLALAEERFQVVRPWWDLISQMTIQFSMIIALTSISLDVFSQFGSGIKCTPRNGTFEIGIQQNLFINSACIEHSVSFYVEYFGYVMFVQSLLLIAVDNFWLNWSRTKNRLKAFNDVVQEVHHSVVKRESVNKTLKNVVAKGEEVEEEEEEANVARTLSALASSKNQVQTAEAEEALRLNEKLRSFFRSSRESKLLSLAYKTKTLARLLLALLFFFVALYYLIKNVFDFDFPCDLPVLRHEESGSVPTAQFWCVNVTATFSRMLVVAFIVVIVVNIVACVAALIGWDSVLAHLPAILDDYIGEEEEEEEEGDEAALRESTATFSAAAPEKVGLTPRGVAEFAKTDDVVFLLYLLRQTNETMFAEVLDFASADFHHELLEYLSNRAWPLEKLQSLVRPPPATPTLKIVDANLVLVPPATRHLQDLVEIDLSSNNHLYDLRNLTGQKSLKYLKLRGCNVESIDDLLELKTLVYLDVSDNKVSRVPEEIVRLVRLRYLLLKDNRLRRLPSEILLLPALNYLSVERRLLEGIDSDGVYFERHPFIHGAFVRRVPETAPPAPPHPGLILDAASPGTESAPAPHADLPAIDAAPAEAEVPETLSSMAPMSEAESLGDPVEGSEGSPTG